MAICASKKENFHDLELHMTFEGIWTTWQEEEDQQQILNSNEMTAGAKLTVKKVYLHMSYQQSTYKFKVK